MKFLYLVWIILSLFTSAQAKELCAQDLAHERLKREACQLTWNAQCKQHDQAILALLRESEGVAAKAGATGGMPQDYCNAVEDEEFKKMLKGCNMTAGILLMSLMKNIVARTASGALNAYFVSEMIDEGLKHDHECFNDIQGKAAVVQFYNRKVFEFQKLAAAKGISENFESLKLSMFGDSEANEALKNISCTDLRRHILAKEKKLNESLGRYAGVREHKLTQSDLDSIYSAGSNKKFDVPFECFGSAKKWQIRCDLASMAILGGKAAISPLSKRLVARADAFDKQVRNSAVILDAKLSQGRYNLLDTGKYNKDSIYLGVANTESEGTHHYYLIAGEKRFDGWMRFQPADASNLGKRVIGAGKGVVFKINVSEEVTKRAVEAIEKNANSRYLTCFHAACNILSEADIVIPGNGSGPPLRLMPVLKGLVNGEVKAGGKNASVEVLASSKEELEHFLKEVRSSSQESTAALATAGALVVGVPTGTGALVYHLYTVKPATNKELEAFKAR